MPYTTPTATELKARYPAFADVSDTLIDFAIGDASRFVDESWAEEDYQRAIMALGAHILVGEGALGARTDVGLISSDKLGDAATTFTTGSSSGSISGFSSTAYGRAFMRIQQVNVTSVVII